MNEHQRWFWRMDHDDRERAIDNWQWEAMIRGFQMRVPIAFAALQFKCAMDLAAMTPEQITAEAAQ